MNSSAHSPFRAPIDIRALLNKKLPDLDFVLPGLLAGTVGSLIGAGGVGKSMFALQAAHCVACGADLLACGADLLGLGEQKLGRAVYLSADDDADALHERLHAIGKLLTPEQRKEAGMNLTVLDWSMEAPDLFNSVWVDSLEHLAQGARLLIIDPLRRFHLADENDSAQMSALMIALEVIAHRSKCAVVFLHGSTKSAAISRGDNQHAARGSSVLSDFVRWQSFLVQMTKDEAADKGVPEGQRASFVRFGVSKVNYAPPQDDVWLKRGDSGVLLPAKFGRAAPKAKPSRAAPARSPRSYSKTVKAASAQIDDDEW